MAETKILSEEINVMSKILVTTDFSDNSKTGICFAIQLASQAGYELIFYNAIKLLKPTSWSPDRYKKYVASEIEQHQNKLEQFISVICKKNNFSPVKYKCVSEIGIGFESQLALYAKKIKADFICISTKGAGNIEKLFGTNASAIITTSAVPVLVVPHSYRTKPIATVWYASDLQNLEKELKTIGKFANPLKAKIEVIHYDYPVHLEDYKTKFRKIQSKYSSENIQLQFKKLDIEYSLTHHIQRDIKKSKPSLMVLFTKQNRNWFDRLFLSSQAAELSFDTKIPMLVFRKT